MCSLDMKSVKNFGHMKQIARDFTPLHQTMIYVDPLTDFWFLTDDRSVNSKTFRGIARVTANF